MKGVQLDQAGWLPLVVGKSDLMSTITLYATEEGWEALQKKNLSLDKHRARAAGLPGTVEKIYALWLEQRREEIARGTLPEVVRREPRSGIRTRSAATILVPADRARSSSNVTEALTGCSEAHAES